MQPQPRKKESRRDHIVEKIKPKKNRLYNSNKDKFELTYMFCKHLEELYGLSDLQKEFTIEKISSKEFMQLCRDNFKFLNLDGK